MERIRNWLNNKTGEAPQEYIDHVIMTKMWRCTPAVFREQDEGDIALAVAIYNAENKAEWKNGKREEQERRRRARM